MQTIDPFARQEAPAYQLTLWPNRSLDRSGFRTVLLLASLGMAIPIVPLLGTPIGVALLPFGIVPVLMLYLFFKRNYRDGTLTEELRLWPDMIAVERRDPRGRVRRWQANPYWVSVHMREDGPVKNYLTLKGNGREIELGAFLSPEERISLRHEVERALRDLRT